MPSCRRHRSALVSRRRAHCMHAPELCRQARLQRPTLFKTTLYYTAAIASLAAWMLRHGQHVRSLRVISSMLDVSSAEAQAHLTSCLAACAGPGSQLEVLRVSVAPLVVAAWAPALRTLRQLQLGGPSGELFISSSLHGLTQLTRLVLVGSPVSFAEGARLPASIEELRFVDHSSDQVPEQVS